MASDDTEHLLDLLKRALPEIRLAATTEARANLAPTGLRKRTEKLQLLREIEAALSVDA
jgi:hypothetical protein